MSIAVEAEDVRILMFKTNATLKNISKWMKKSDLQIALQKTEVVIFKGL